MSLKPSEEIPDKRQLYGRSHLHLNNTQLYLHNILCVNGSCGCGQIKVSLQVMKRSSMTHGISSSAASKREIKKHASIDPCTRRVRKNNKYTELKLYFAVYVYVFLPRVILIVIQSSQPSSASISLQKTCYLQLDTCYTIQHSIVTKESSQGCFFSSKIKPHNILVTISFCQFCKIPVASSTADYAVITLHNVQ